MSTTWTILFNNVAYHLFVSSFAFLADEVDYLLTLPSGSPPYQYIHRVKLQDRFGDQMAKSPSATLSDYTNRSRVSISARDITITGLNKKVNTICSESAMLG